jgi:hypothetical protein
MGSLTVIYIPNFDKNVFRHSKVGDGSGDEVGDSQRESLEISLRRIHLTGAFDSANILALQSVYKKNRNQRDDVKL